MYYFSYAVILIYFSLHVVFSLNLKVFSYIFSYTYAFSNNIVLTFLSFLTFLFTMFNNSPYSRYVNSFCVVSFDVIRPLRGICDKQGFTKFLTILPNCSVGVTVADDKYANSSIYIFGFHDFLFFTSDLYILWPLKLKA